MKYLLLLILLSSGCEFIEAVKKNQAQAESNRYYFINQCITRAAHCDPLSTDPTCINFIASMRGRTCEQWYSDNYSF